MMRRWLYDRRVIATHISDPVTQRMPRSPDAGNAPAWLAAIMPTILRAVRGSVLGPGVTNDAKAGAADARAQGVTPMPMA